MIDIAVALTATQAIISSGKKALEVIDRLKHVELHGVMVDLMDQAVELKSQLVDLKEENTQIREELAAMRRRKDIRSKLRKQDNLYFLNEPVEGYGDGPFCTGCMDKDEKLISLDRGRRHIGWTCPVCKRHP